VPRYFQPSTASIEECHDLEEDDMAVKFGRSSGFTRGTFSAIKSHCKLQYSLGETIEHLFVGSGGLTPFGERGDSGSWVLGEKGQLGGMLIGGQEQHGWSYVTPISSVLDDIQVRLHCRVTLLE